MLGSTQKTINCKVSCNSIALHSGVNVNMTLHPAQNNTGIVFLETYLDSKINQVQANYLNVTTTNLGTTIANQHKVSVSTIEHLMASIWGLGIDNLIVELDGPEVPIMDGSSEPFVFLIECAGIKLSDEPRKFIEITKKFRYQEEDKFIEVEPSKHFELDLAIDFNNIHITKNNLNYHANLNSFKNDICRARTFCFESEIKTMQSLGLAKGGNLNNAVVISENGILNDDHLRYPDEFVKHKTLDFLGDIRLAENFIIGKFNGFKTGHKINNNFLRSFMASKDCWTLT